MKKLMLLVFATICTISISVAQERGGRQGQGQQRSPEEFAKSRLERLTTTLSLSKTQQDSIYNVFLQQQKSFQANRGENNRQGASSEGFREAMQQQNAKIKSFLTPEQIKKYEELQSQQQGQRQRAPRD